MLPTSPASRATRLAYLACVATVTVTACHDEPAAPSRPGLADSPLTGDAVGSPSTWNASADFSSAENPHESWSSGWMLAPGSNLHLYTVNLAYGERLTWQDPIFGGDVPHFAKNTSATDVIYGSLPGQVALHPGCADGPYSVLRWVAPAASSYNVQAHLFAGDFGDTEAFIVKSGNATTPVFSATTTSGNPSFSGVLALNANDALDFVVGVGSDFCYGSDRSATFHFVR